MWNAVPFEKQIQEYEQRIRELETLCAYWRDGYSSQSVYNSGREEVFLKRISELEAENARLRSIINQVSEYYGHKLDDDLRIVINALEQKP